MKHPQSTHEPKPATVHKTPGKSRSPAARKHSVTGNGADRDETIRLTAYSFYEARGCTDGHALDDWLKAQAAFEQSNGRA